MRRRRKLFWAVLAVILAFGGAALRAQDKAEAAKPNAPAEPTEGKPVTDLGTRFQFSERYSLDEAARAQPAIGQYKIGIRETMKVVEERSQTSPSRTEGTVQAIFTERPARVSDIGVVMSTVRHYDTYRQTPNPFPKKGAVPALQGMALYYQPRIGGSPQVLSLTEGRGLREIEYMSVDQEIFMPSLASLLPAQPSRIGDRWTISRTGTWALLNESPGRGAPLLGHLEMVQQVADGADWEAIITIDGKVSLPRGDTTVNARVIFKFAPPPPPDTQGEPTKPATSNALVQARGAITELRMTSVTTTLLSGSSRLRRITTQQLTLGRQFVGTDAPLAIPEPLPTATEENSWLLYDDPDGIFHFRHPQEFQLGPLTNPGDSVELLRGAPKAPDRMEFLIQHKTGDAEADRNNRTPDFHVKLLNESWRQAKQDILPGPMGWLPDAEWAPLKMKVYRINAALRASGAKRDARVYFDEYLVQFARDESLILKSTTVQDPPGPFRSQVEAVLKTFKMGKSTSK